MPKHFYVSKAHFYTVIFGLMVVFSAYIKVAFLPYIVASLLVFYVFQVTKVSLIYYYLPLFFLLVLIFFGNAIAIHNYFDYTLKGSIKLLFFIFLSPVIATFLLRMFDQNLFFFKNAMWFLFAAGIVFESGINLQNIGQILALFFLVGCEFIYYLRTGKKTGLILILIVLLITTKKQAILSSLLLMYFVDKRIILKFTPYILLSVVIIFLFGGIENKAAGVVSEHRIANTFSSRIFTPEMSGNGNPRMYMLVFTLPRAFDESIWFGYGLGRYGNIDAYRQGRDVERNKLGMANFIPVEFNPKAVFGSIAADVGIVVILMQMGVLGVLFYFILILGLSKLFKLKRRYAPFIIVIPFFLGGPVVMSVMFPLLIGLIIAVLKFSETKNIYKTRQKICV